MLVILALGCAAFVAVVTINFGAAAAAAIMGVVSVFYLTLNAIAGDKKDDKKALISRLFRISWITHAASAVVWAGAIGAALYPFMQEVLFDDLKVTVVDELRLPVSDAEVSMTLGNWHRSVAVSNNGVASLSYPLRWGPKVGSLRITERGKITELQILRKDARFEELVVSIGSNTPRFRVTHLSLRLAAIDAVLRGTLPPDLADRFPHIVGAIENAVWVETNSLLSNYPETNGATYFGSRLEESLSIDIPAAAPRYSNISGNGDIPKSIAHSRLAKEFYANAQVDLSQGIFGCPADVPLGGDYRAEINTGATFNTGNLARLDDVAEVSLRQRNLNFNRDERGLVSILMRRLVDFGFLSELLRAATPVPASYGMTKDGIAGYLRFMIDHRIPRGVIDTMLNLTHDDGCGDGNPTEITLTLPPPVLRVTIIENISENSLPISDIQASITERTQIVPLPLAGRGRTMAVHWQSEILKPGEAIVIPRKLMVEGTMTPSQVADWQEAAQSPLTELQVVQRSVNGAPDVHAARAFVIGTNQLIQGAPPQENEQRPLYVIGPSIEHVSIKINDVWLPLRDDTGKTLTILMGYEFGSCPYVFTSAANDMPEINRGQIIRDQLGSANERDNELYIGQRLHLVEIRELEDEVSHINRVSLVMRERSGRTRLVDATDPVIRKKDRSYATLRKGDVLRLHFPPIAQSKDASFYLRVRGYYTLQSHRRFAAASGL